MEISQVICFGNSFLNNICFLSEGQDCIQHFRYGRNEVDVPGSSSKTRYLLLGTDTLVIEYHCLLLQSFSCVWLSFDLMDCSLPSFSVHGIFQARILEWVAILFSSLNVVLYSSLNLAVSLCFSWHDSFPNKFWYFLAVPCSMWNLISPIRDWILDPYIGREES